MVVDFPDPFGPRKPCTSPVRTTQVQPVQRTGAAEGLDDPVTSIAVRRISTGPGRSGP